MKKYIVILLMLVSGSALLAQDENSSNGVTPSVIEITPPTRTITQGEIDGTDPIIIKVNQQFIIPLHYHPSILSNSIDIFFGPQDSDILSVTSGGDSFDPHTAVLDINLICTGKKLGQETVSFGSNGKIIHQFSIQVVE